LLARTEHFGTCLTGQSGIFDPGQLFWFPREARDGSAHLAAEVDTTREPWRSLMPREDYLDIGMGKPGIVLEVLMRRADRNTLDPRLLPPWVAVDPLPKWCSLAAVAEWTRQQKRECQEEEARRAAREADPAFQEGQRRQEQVRRDMRDPRGGMPDWYKETLVGR
jgi:hypothetical protein